MMVSVSGGVPTPHPLAQVGHKLLLARVGRLDLTQLCLSRLARSGLGRQHCRGGCCAPVGLCAATTALKRLKLAQPPCTLGTCSLQGLLCTRQLALHI